MGSESAFMFLLVGLYLEGHPIKTSDCGLGVTRAKLQFQWDSPGPQTGEAGFKATVESKLKTKQNDGILMVNDGK